jgi:choline dehydrogenase-like flavoprotein
MSSEAGAQVIECELLIVGAGSAGCALAGRWRARGGGRVVVLEAGPDPTGRPAAERGGLDDAGRLDAAYDPTWSRGDLVRLDDARSTELRRGVVLGGSSAVNGTYFVHARPEDVARWTALTGGRWSAERVAAAVERLERDVELGGRRGHGSAGPMPVTRDRSPSVVTDAFFAACGAAGYAAVDDLNGAGATDGYGLVPRNALDGRRVSTAEAYLRPLAEDHELIVRSATSVDRLVVERGRVRGALATAPDGAVVVHAEQVVLCAGAVGSPLLLARSGLGPAPVPNERAGSRVADLPGLGAAVWNHPCVELTYRPRTGVVDPGANGFLQGALHTGGVEVLATRLPYGVVTGQHPGDELLSLRITLMTPLGRGTLDLTDGAVALRHDPLADPADRASLREAVRAVDALARGADLAGVTEQWFGPSPAELGDDGLLDDWLRGRIGFAFHLGGSCPVGDDPRRGAVVDAAFAVHGVDGLRVVDTSVLAEPVSRGPAATAVLLGELAADELSGPASVTS